MPSYTGGLTTDGVKLAAFLNSAEKTSASVGFLGDKSYPNGMPVGQVARQNEFGDVNKNQPPRPFMRPAIEGVKDKAGPLSANLAAAAVEGSVSVNDLFTNLCLMAQQEIVSSIEAVNTPALSALTIANRRERGNTSTKPLEDTLLMKSSVDFEVNET